jgi:hypothetical protein
MEKTKQQVNRRRYKLHYKLRKMGYKIITSKLTIEVQDSEFINMCNDSSKKHKYIKELQELNYSVQSVI